MLLKILLVVICFSGGTLSNSLFKPCKLEDDECIEKTMQEIIPKVTNGIPSMGIPPSDPLFVEKIEGNISILKIKLLNTTVTGLKNCEVKNLELSKELTSLRYDLHCPSLKLVGKYDADGRLIVLPVQGNGDYTLTTGKYILTADVELKKVEGSDGKMYLSIKNFKLGFQPLTQTNFEFKNLFNGRKDLSDTVHDFAHQNWKEVVELLQEPIWYTAVKKTYSHVNKFLKRVPLDEMFIS